MKAKILLINNDSHVQTELYKAINEFDEAKFSVTTIKSFEFNSYTNYSESDLILISLCDSITLSTIKEIRIRAEFVPLMILSNEMHSSFIIDIMKLGVKDFIFKNEGSFTIIPHRIKMCIEEQRVQKILARRLKNKEETDVRLDTLKKTLATISHYINNSTTAISGYAQLCKMVPSNEEIKDQFIELSLKESEKISIVIEEFERAIKTKKEFSTTDYVGLNNTIFDMNENIRRRYKLRNPT